MRILVLTKLQSRRRFKVRLGRNALSMSRGREFDASHFFDVFLFISMRPLTEEVLLGWMSRDFLK
jgi:hypothetical protein